MIVMSLVKSLMIIKNGIKKRTVITTLQKTSLILFVELLDKMIAYLHLTIIYSTCAVGFILYSICIYVYI